VVHRRLEEAQLQETAHHQGIVQAGKRSINRHQRSRPQKDPGSKSAPQAANPKETEEDAKAGIDSDESVGSDRGEQVTSGQQDVRQVQTRVKGQ